MAAPQAVSRDVLRLELQESNSRFAETLQKLKWEVVGEMIKLLRVERPHNMLSPCSSPAASPRGALSGTLSGTVPSPRGAIPGTLPSPRTTSSGKFSKISVPPRNSMRLSRDFLNESWQGASTMTRRWSKEAQSNGNISAVTPLAASMRLERGIVPAKSHLKRTWTGTGLKPSRLSHEHSGNFDKQVDVSTALITEGASEYESDVADSEYDDDDPSAMVPATSHHKVFFEHVQSGNFVLSGNKQVNHTFMDGLVQLTMSTRFEYFSALSILFSTASLTWETDFKARCPEQPLPLEVIILNEVFLAIFIIELLMRATTQGFYDYMCRQSPDMIWNWLDFALATVALSSKVSGFFYWELRGNAHNSTAMVQLARFGRLLRVVRMFRLFRLLNDLHMLVMAISMSMKSLGWTVVLLSFLILFFSVFFTEALYMATHMGTHVMTVDTHKWFGGVFRTALTLLEAIMGGVSWDDVVRPLMQTCPILGTCFIAYVAFCALSVLNVVTGVFVGKASNAASEEKDASLVNCIGDLFYQERDKATEITFQEFQSKLEHGEMQDYFRDLNVDISEAEGLFRLLDVDGSGSVDSEEIVSGCLRLRGNAKAIELALLAQETRLLRSKIDGLITAVSMQRGAH